MAQHPQQRPHPPSDPALQHLPPQSIEAEESLLAAILLDNDTWYDVAEILTPEDFYRTAHQKIFSAVVDLMTRSEPADLVTLTNMLREKGLLEAIGGASFLASMVDSVPLAVNAQYYAKIIHDKACLRRLIEQSNAISRKCFENQGDIDEVMDFAESAIFEISENKVKKAFFPIREILQANIDTLEQRHSNKSLYTGLPTGFSRFDTLTSGMQASDLIILAARPSMGKTALALNIARNAAVESGAPTAIFSLEMSKEQLSMRMLCAEARIDSAKLRNGFFTQEDWQRINEAASRLTTAPIYIDDNGDCSVLDIRAKSRRLKMDKGLGLVIIDYLQLMRANTRSERRDLEISEISRSLKALAKELHLPVLALSQLNRKLEERSDKRPQLADLRESGALEQDADIVAFIYRDEVYNKEPNNPKKGTAEIILAKHRNGPTGIVPLTFLNIYTRFENPASEPSL
jgi:replicative DNA helicase